MMNKILAFAAVVAVGWAVTTLALREPPARLAVAAGAMPGPPRPSYAVASRDTVDTHQSPVPIMRSARPSLTISASPDVQLPVEDAGSRDRMDRGAAKAAIEADGYKGVSVLDQGLDGAWRARAYRGTTEVQLIVDGAGRVSAR
jgi:hypothetical protein